MLGYLPQEFGFYPDFTVKDYLLYIASLKGIRPMVAGKRVKDLLAQVGLTKSANKKMRKLSGGMASERSTDRMSGRNSFVSRRFKYQCNTEVNKGAAKAVLFSRR